MRYKVSKKDKIKIQSHFSEVLNMSVTPKIFEYSVKSNAFRSVYDHFLQCKYDLKKNEYYKEKEYANCLENDPDLLFKYRWKDFYEPYQFFGYWSHFRDEEFPINDFNKNIANLKKLIEVGLDIELDATVEKESQKKEDLTEETIKITTISGPKKAGKIELDIPKQAEPIKEEDLTEETIKITTISGPKKAGKIELDIPNPVRHSTKKRHRDYNYNPGIQEFFEKTKSWENSSNSVGLFDRMAKVLEKYSERWEKDFEREMEMINDGFKKRGSWNRVSWRREWEKRKKLEEEEEN